MVCVPVRSIIPSLKLGDYLSIQAHKPCSISHLLTIFFAGAAVPIKISGDRYRCNVCGKNLSERNRWRHMRIHSTMTAVKCEICNKQMSRNSSLMRHLSVVHKVFSK